MKGDAPVSGITGVPGWESPAEQALLFKLASGLPKGSLVVEIGAEYGMSSSILAKGAPTGYIYSVDVQSDEKWALWESNLEEAGLLDKTAGQYHMSSADALKALGEDEDLENGIGLLFVDGDHSYEGALLDLRSWTPFVKDGGLVVIHDVAMETNLNPHPLHHEVARAVDTWLSEMGEVYEHLDAVDSMLVLKKTVPAAKPKAAPAKKK